MPEYTQMGPEYAEVSAAVTAGQVLMPDTGGLVKPTTGAVATVVGVARDDASPASAGSPTNFATLRPEVAMYQAPYTVRCKFAADCDYGVRVTSAATGQVTPVGAAAASDGTQVIGICMERGGVTAGAFGLVKLV
jgi:hypothetical protein